MSPLTTCRLPLHIQNCFWGLRINQEKSPHPTELQHFLLSATVLAVELTVWHRSVMQVGDISMEFSFPLHTWRECRSVSALTLILFAPLTPSVFAPYTWAPPVFFQPITWKPRARDEVLPSNCVRNWGALLTRSCFELLRPLYVVSQACPAIMCHVGLFRTSQFRLIIYKYWPRKKASIPRLVRVHIAEIASQKLITRATSGRKCRLSKIHHSFIAVWLN